MLLCAQTLMPVTVRSGALLLSDVFLSPSSVTLVLLILVKNFSNNVFQAETGTAKATSPDVAVEVHGVLCVLEPTRKCKFSYRGCSKSSKKLRKAVHQLLPEEC